MTDRICIASKGAQKFHISAQDLLTCCGFSCGNGCDGVRSLSFLVDIVSSCHVPPVSHTVLFWQGYPAAAWAHFKSTGIVTGGNYNTSQGCSPYS